jgi:hypothetical protein
MRCRFLAPSGSGASDAPSVRIRRVICKGIIMKPRPTISHQLSSSQVVLRFVFRLALLSTFAIFGTQGFGTTFATLLALSAIFCAVVGVVRCEAMFGPVLTHWDEAAAYAVIGRLVSMLS